ncbi:MAG: peroxiredoxin [Bradymonadaceae bacterium]|nr:peroxiredoxin [Lujinxingiaceae bacterium]
MLKRLVDKIPINKGAVKRGQKAPDFTLPDQDDNPVRLYDVLERGPVMVIFYPGDFTPVCTAQLCSYRDQYAAFRDFGLELLGISDDPVSKHQHFRTKQSLPFALLADPEHKVVDLYSGSSVFSSGRANRANYIIGKDATVLYAHVETISTMHRTSEDILVALGELKAAGKL